MSTIYRHWIEEIQRNKYHAFDDLKNSTHNYLGVDGKEDIPNPYHREHNGNVWGHTLDVYNQARELYPDDEILQLAALLHDIGKPACREENHEKGRASFHSHESFGVAKAAELLEILHISHDEKIRVLELIQRHADSYKMADRKLKAYYNKEAFKDLVKIRWCDSLGRECDDFDEVIEQIKEMETKYDNFIDYFNNYSNGVPECTMLIGPPCSGKSTWIENNNVSNILSRDNIITDMFPFEHYTDAWDLADQKLVDKVLRDNKKEFVDSKKDFTIDMTNMTIKSRNRHIHDMKGKYNLKAKVFVTGYSELLHRNANREEKVLAEGIINSMCKRWQLPVSGEGFYNIEYIFN